MVKKIFGNNISSTTSQITSSRVILTSNFGCPRYGTIYAHGSPFLEHATSRTNYYVVYSRENAFPPFRINPPFPPLPPPCVTWDSFFPSFFHLSPPIQLFREKYCIQYTPRRTTSTFIKYKQFHTSSASTRFYDEPPRISSGIPSP